MSPRVFAIFALFAIAAALPAGDKPAQPTLPEEQDDSSAWPFFTKIPFMSFFSPIWDFFPSFVDFGPKIEVDDKSFRVIVKTDTYQPEDLKVEVKNDFIFIQGTHEAKKGSHDLIASQFFYTYTLPANSSASDVSAKVYTDGILEVVVPLNGPSEERVEKRIVPITEAGVPYNTEKTEVAVDDKKDGDDKKDVTESDREPTTSPTLNEVDSAANEVQP